MKEIFTEYLRSGCARQVKEYLDRNGVRSKVRISRSGRTHGGVSITRGSIYHVLSNRFYIGEIAHKDEVHRGLHEPIIDVDLWERVQAKLTQSRVTRRTRWNQPNGSLLTGILFDTDQNRYLPTHTTKQGRRYRYYTAAPVHELRQAPSDLSRVPAREIEDLVYARIRSLLGSPGELLRLCQSAKVGDLLKVTTAAQVRLSRLRIAPLKESVEFLRSIVTRVVIGDAKATIAVDANSLLNALLDRKPPAGNPEIGQTDNPIVQISAPMEVKRRGSELRIVIPATSQSDRKPVPALVKAIARAHDWSERILSGEISRLEDLARETGFTTRYIGRTLKSAAMAPDLVQQILDGQQSPDLTVRKLLAGFPLEWKAQTATARRMNVVFCSRPTKRPCGLFTYLSTLSS